MRRPALPAALLVFALWLGAYFALGAPPLAGGGESGSPTLEMAKGPPVQLVLAVVVLAAASAILRWPGLGLGRPAPGSWRLAWLPALYIAFFLTLAALREAPFGGPTPMAAALLLLTCLLVGLSEEGMFRSVLYAGLRSALRPWPSVLVATVLFGAVHTTNALATGALGAAAVQSVNATIMGLALMGLRLRCGSLWPAVVVHVLWDYALFLLDFGNPLPVAETRPPVAAQLLPSLLLLPLGLYGLWLLRGLGSGRDGGRQAPRSGA